jgi:hypothetical protein
MQPNRPAARHVDGPLPSFNGYDEASYDEQFEAMVFDTNRDPELQVLNHLLFDLLTPFALDEKARAYGLVEVQHALRKFWLPWLQQGGKGHFHVIRHLVRQIMAHFTRSERRAAAAFRAAAPNLDGGFGKSIETDAIQELYVLLVVVFLKAPGTVGLHKILERVAANLHLPMTIIPELDRRWAKSARSTTHRRSRGADAELVRRLGRLAECCYLVHDPGRAVQSGHEGELGRLLRATKFTAVPCGEGLDAKCFIYPHLAGGPPVLADVAVAKAAFVAPSTDADAEASDGEASLDSVTSAGDMSDPEEVSAAKAATIAAASGSEEQCGLGGVAAGDWLEGIEYEPSAKFRPAHRSSHSGRLAGYVRNRHRGLSRPYFPSETYRRELTVSSFTELTLLPSSAGPWLVCRWIKLTADPSLAWVRRLLPEGCHVVQLSGKPSAASRRMVSRVS